LKSFSKSLRNGIKIGLDPTPDPSPTMGKGAEVPLPIVGERDLGSGVEFY